MSTKSYKRLHRIVEHSPYQGNYLMVLRKEIIFFSEI